jgi:hypothetical protein
MGMPIVSMLSVNISHLQPKQNYNNCILRPNGVTFVAAPATTALSSKWQLKPGDVVTFKHKGIWVGSKKPKAPTIYRLRPEKTWADVVASFQENKRIPTGKAHLIVLVAYKFALHKFHPL